MKRIASTFALLLFVLLLAGCSDRIIESVPVSVAHRGGHIDNYIPENSVAGVRMAARYGFKAFECDAHYTKDSVIVLMHDGTINRTMRNASDYSEIAEKVYYKDLTYQELKENYVLASDDPELRTPIPTLEEFLVACKETGIMPMLHSDLVEAYRMAHEYLGDDFIAFDGSYVALSKSREFSNCLILWDPGTTPADEAVEKLKALGGPCGVSSMKDKLLTADYNKAVTDAGFEVQSSIFPTPKEMQCVADGATIVLSDFSLFVPRDSKGKPVRKPTDKDVLRNETLEAGEAIELTFDSIEYGSIEVGIRFSGELELVVNGERHYDLSGEGVTRIGGWRFYNLAPTITLTAKSSSTVEQLDVMTYSY